MKQAPFTKAEIAAILSELDAPTLQQEPRPVTTRDRFRAWDRKLSPVHGGLFNALVWVGGWSLGHGLLVLLDWLRVPLPSSWVNDSGWNWPIMLVVGVAAFVGGFWSYARRGSD